MFLKIEGFFICPDCDKTYPVSEEFCGDTAMFDSNFEIECTCGLVFTMNLDLNSEAL